MKVIPFSSGKLDNEHSLKEPNKIVPGESTAQMTGAVLIMHSSPTR